MTPVEAMKDAVARSREIGTDGVYTDHEQVMAELRTLGFTVVPVEPTDEQVEAMERAISGSYVMGWVRHWEKEARAAYAAAIGKERDDA